MFTAARYIAIDDDRTELGALVDALHAIGAPCIGIQFNPQALPDPELFKGLRILITDLNLVKGVPNGEIHYNTIASIIDTCVPDHHGPFVVVLWTSHEHERDALTARLDAVLPPEKKPLAVLALDKNQYRDGDAWKAPELQQDIRQKLSESAQLSALLSWERDVLGASNATLSLLGSLVPPADRTPAGYPAALDRILSLLATAAAGVEGGAKNPRSAVSAALAPLLADRILNQSDDAGASELWTKAVTFPAGGHLTKEQKASMNRMLHFAVPPSETVANADWGAVTPLGPKQLTDDAMKKRFGATAEQLLKDEFRVHPDKLKDGQLVLLRVGAVCDQAQVNAGPIPTLLGVLVPTASLNNSKRPGPAVLKCPEEILLKEADGPLSLLVNARFPTSLVTADFEEWPAAILRVREQLLMTILVHSATHVMRPGTLSF